MTRRTPHFIEVPREDEQEERARALAALAQTPAEAAPKYFYDKVGSHLFDAITELPEYYPTRSEAGIFSADAPDMARQIGPASTFVDLGAGNCAKAARLLPLLDPRRYVAVDISSDYLHEALRGLQREHPSLDIVGIGMDFSRSPQLPAGILQPDGSRPVFFYAGSSIGNFSPVDAEAFLAGVCKQARGGGLLIGVDLVKPTAVLEAAYDDAVGVTSAFNLNLLRNLNRVLGTDFNPTDWRHIAFYDAEHSRIEMHLEARRALTVHWPEGARRFAAGERLHTENSYKYTTTAFAGLLRRAGFQAGHCWSASDDSFAVFWSPA